MCSSTLLEKLLLQPTIHSKTTGIRAHPGKDFFMAQTAKIVIHPSFQIGDISPRLFSTFLEPIGTMVNGTMYNPKHPTANALGFRQDVIDALKNGQMVVTLQDKGHFTSKGHFLLLTNYYPEDQTIQVRDSNIYNYANLPGHKVDRFSQNLISKSNKNYYIIQPKIVSIPACSRCGSTPSVSGCPLTQDYTCEKCAAALTRRDCFLSLLG